MQQLLRILTYKNTNNIRRKHLLFILKNFRTSVKQKSEGKLVVDKINYQNLLDSKVFSEKKGACLQCCASGSEIICKLGSGSVIHSGSDSGFKSRSKLSSVSD